MGFHPPNFGLPRPFRSRIMSRHATDRRTDRQPRATYNAPSPTGAGHNNATASLATVMRPSVIYEKKWKTSHFVLSRRRASFDFHKIFHDDRGGPWHHLTLKLFLGPSNSLAARDHQKFGWKCPHLGELFIILSFIEIKQPNLADLCRLRTRINL